MPGENVFIATLRAGRIILKGGTLERKLLGCQRPVDIKSQGGETQKEINTLFKHSRTVRKESRRYGLHRAR